MLFFSLSSVDEAVAEITSFLKTTLFRRQEDVSLEDADGRITAEDVTASENVPNYRKSTVDGFAVRARDTDGASASVPALVRLTGAIRMGEVVTAPLRSGETAAIPTGGMLPPGADAVVMVEDSETHQDDVFFAKSVAPGMHTIDVGEDIARGACILPARTRLGPAALGALASLSLDTVSLIARPRYAVISTGDEIRPWNQPLGIGEVRDTNAVVLKSQIRRLGGVVTYSAIVADDPEQLKNTLERAAAEADIVLVAGGSSGGERDFTQRIVAWLPESRIVIHGLAAKPGKPTLVAMSRSTLILGLPGHPASCSLIFQVMMRPAFNRLGLIGPGPAPVPARLLEPCHGSPGRRTFQTVRLETDDAGQPVCRPLRGQSGLVSLLASSSGYFVIPEDEEGVNAGQTVLVYSLEGGSYG